MDPKCNLIVDSCCDLPYELIDVPGVFLLKFPYVLGGEERVDDLYRTTTPKEFYDAMRDRKRPFPTTAQIPARVLDDAFRRACASGVPTVYLSFSSALSGSYETALLVRDQVLADYPEAHLYVVDTMLASIAEGLLVLAAIKQREAGLSAEELVSWAEEARWYVNAQFMVDSFDALHRGGRVPAGVAAAGAKLDVKPLLGFDLKGALSFSGMARGRKKGLRSMGEYLRRRSDPTQIGRRVIIGNADAAADAKRLRDDLLETEDGLLFTDTYIGPVIGSHVGPGMVALAFFGPDRREDLSISDRIANRVRS